ncbi:MAG TPA: hypothetical protein VIM30_13340 [Candidatus Limnocylindrales bacterium]
MSITVTDVVPPLVTSEKVVVTGLGAPVAVVGATVTPVPLGVLGCGVTDVEGAELTLGPMLFVAVTVNV